MTARIVVVRWLFVASVLLGFAPAQAAGLPIPRYLRLQGVTQLYGTGVSSFRGSPPFRIQNLINGARKLDGTVIYPGKVFNFNASVGDISEARGFTKGYIIKGGTLEKDVGGGICQVSTTIFRAAYLSGLPIIERNYHSYHVRYYDPLGLEATVFGPWKNFKFLNDTRTPLLIRVGWNLRKQTLWFYLYGGARDRNTVVNNAVVTRTLQPGPGRFIWDDQVRYGHTHQVDWPQLGYDLYTTRTVNYFGGRSLRDQMRSVYQPWGAIWGVHKNDQRLLAQQARETPKVAGFDTTGIFGTPIVLR